ncbi:hypothetical protein [Nesterenkonia alba]|uniref:hypothetical protein n=1 Tax=Nesterenkonia alba TaxID=515814 RepID=UPI0003B69AE3|nr:hypothetical protein [Nesterenkonia alba]
MAHTEKQSPYRWMSKESSKNRKRLTRVRRRLARMAIKQRDYEKASEKEPGTQGWMTW